MPDAHLVVNADELVLDSTAATHHHGAVGQDDQVGPEPIDAHRCRLLVGRHRTRDVHDPGITVALDDKNLVFLEHHRWKLIIVCEGRDTDLRERAVTGWIDGHDLAARVHGIRDERVDEAVARNPRARIPPIQHCVVRVSAGQLLPARAWRVELGHAHTLIIAVDAARDKDLAVGQSHHRRVPAPVVHGSGLRLNEAFIPPAVDVGIGDAEVNEATAKPTRITPSNQYFAGLRHNNGGRTKKVRMRCVLHDLMLTSDGIPDIKIHHAALLTLNVGAV